MDYKKLRSRKEYKAIVDFAREHEMFGNVGRLGVVCGISGGADSVFLLHVLSALASDRKCNPDGTFTIRAVHINHMIRGEEADRDEAFVAGLCKELGVELTI